MKKINLLTTDQYQHRIELHFQRNAKSKVSCYVNFTIAYYVIVIGLFTLNLNHFVYFM